jgi:hypothetical protein
MENNKTYAIVPIAELNNIDYSEVEQNSADTVRKNLADTEFVVKWEGATPSTVAAITPSPTEYTHANILVEMAKDTWTDPDLEI